MKRLKQLLIFVLIIGILNFGGLGEVIKAFAQDTNEDTIDTSVKLGSGADDLLNVIYDLTRDPNNPPIILNPEDQRAIDQYAKSIYNPAQESDAISHDLEIVNSVKDMIDKLPTDMTIQSQDFNSLAVTIETSAAQSIDQNIIGNLDDVAQRLKNSNPDTRLATVESIQSIISGLLDYLGAGGTAQEPLKPLDRRVVATLNYLVKPSILGGAGHERIKVKSIWSGYDENTLSKHVEDADYKSVHGGGKALDITEIDYLRCTTAKYRHIGGKKKTKQPLVPIKVSYQTEQGVASAPLPAAASANLMFAGSIDQLLIAALADLGLPLDPSATDFSNPSLEGFLKYAGASLLGQISADGKLPTGNNLNMQATITEYGRGVLGAYLGVPAEALAGNDSQNMIENIGRYVLENRMHLPPHSLEGTDSISIVNSIGKRVVETNLALKPGSINGFKPATEAQFQIMIGQALIESTYNLPFGSFFGSSTEIKKRIGTLRFSQITTDLNTVANSVEATTDEIALFKSDKIAEFLQKIGTRRLATRAYVYAKTTDTSQQAREEAWGMGKLPGIFETLYTDYTLGIYLIGKERLAQATATLDSERQGIRDFFATLDAKYLPGSAIAQSTGLTVNDYVRLFTGNGAKEIFDRLGRDQLQNNTLGLQGNGVIASKAKDKLSESKTFNDLFFRQQKLRQIQSDAKDLERFVDDVNAKAKVIQLEGVAQSNATSLKPENVYKTAKTMFDLADSVDIVGSSQAAVDALNRLRCDLRAFQDGYESGCLNTSNLKSADVKSGGTSKVKINPRDVVDLLSGKTDPNTFMLKIGAGLLDDELNLPAGTLNLVINEKITDQNEFMIAVGASKLDSVYHTKDPQKLSDTSENIDKNLGLKKGTTAKYRSNSLPASALDKNKPPEPVTPRFNSIDAIASDKKNVAQAAFGGTTNSNSSTRPISSTPLPGSLDAVKEQEKIQDTDRKREIERAAKDQANRNEQDRRYLAEVGKATLERQAIGNIGQLSGAGVVLSGLDIFDLLTGNTYGLAINLAGRKMDAELNLIPGTTAAFLSAKTDAERQAAMIGLGGQYMFNKIGIDGFAIGGVFSIDLAARRIETVLGLAPNTVSDKKSVVEISKLNGLERFADSFGLPDTSFPTDNIPNDYTGEDVDKLLMGPDSIFVDKVDGKTKSSGLTRKFLLGTLSTHDYIQKVADNFARNELTSPTAISKALTNFGFNPTSVNMAINFYNIYQNTNLMNKSYQDWSAGDQAALYTALTSIFTYDLDEKIGITPGTISAMIANPQYASRIAMGEAVKLVGEQIGDTGGKVLTLAYNYYLSQEDPKQDTEVRKNEGTINSSTENRPLTGNPNQAPFDPNNNNFLEEVNPGSSNTSQNTTNTITPDPNLEAQFNPDFKNAKEATKEASLAQSSSNPATKDPKGDNKKSSTIAKLEEKKAELLQKGKDKARSFATQEINKQLSQEFGASFAVFDAQFATAVNNGDLSAMLTYIGVAELLKQVNLVDENSTVPKAFQLTYQDIFDLTLGSDKVYEDVWKQANQEADNKFGTTSINNLPTTHISENGDIVLDQNSTRSNLLLTPDQTITRSDLLDRSTSLDRSPIIPLSSDPDPDKNGQISEGLLANSENTSIDKHKPPANPPPASTKSDRDAYRDARYQELSKAKKSEAQKTAQYKVMDAMLYKKIDTIPAGFSKIMFTGTDAERQNAIGALVINQFIPEKYRAYSSDFVKLVNPLKPGDSESAIVDAISILATEHGVPMTPQSAQIFYNYFKDSSPGNYDAMMKVGLPNMIESYFNTKDVFGFQIPPGTIAALLEYNSTGDSSGLETIGEKLATDKLLHFSDKIFGFKDGTSSQVYSLYTIYSKLQDAGDLSTGQEVALYIQAADLITGGYMTDKFAEWDGKLDLPPGTFSTLLMGALTGNPLTIALGVYSALFGVYKVKVLCTVDGYYPFYNDRTPDLQVGAGDFDGMKTDTYRAGLMKGAGLKVDDLAQDLVVMPFNTNKDGSLSSAKLDFVTTKDLENIRANQIIVLRNETADKAYQMEDYNLVYGTDRPGELSSGGRINIGVGLLPSMTDIVHIGF